MKSITMITPPSVPGRHSGVVDVTREHGQRCDPSKRHKKTRPVGYPRVGTRSSGGCARPARQRAASASSILPIKFVAPRGGF